MDTTSREKIEFYKQNRSTNVITELDFQLIDENRLVNILNKISTNAIGEDLLSVKDLNMCLSFCIKPLINIINSSILESTFPSLWKKAIIKPLNKIPNPKDLKDFRPISILSTVSKIIEAHIHQQITSFVDTFKIIPECQSGFRKNFSTVTSLDYLVNEIRCN